MISYGSGYFCIELKIKGWKRSQRDKYPLAALSISLEPGMTDDPARLSGTNILCFLRAISVARYLSRVCIIVVYYLPLGTFNLHHFLPRRTMPEAAPRSPRRIMSWNFRPLKFQLTMDESCPCVSPNLPWTFVHPRVVCHRDRRKKFHRREEIKKYLDK